MIPSGRKAKYKIPLLSPFALLSPNPAAVLVQIAQPCPHTAGAIIMSNNTTSKRFFIRTKLYKLTRTGKNE